jgi:hypothetical protein
MVTLGMVVLRLVVLGMVQVPIKLLSKNGLKPSKGLKFQVILLIFRISEKRFFKITFVSLKVLSSEF